MSLSNGWEVKPLGEMAKVISGYAFKSQSFQDQGIPVIKIKNIRKGYVDLQDVQFVGTDYLKIDDKYHVSGGNLLISLTGSHLTQPNSVVGRVALHSPHLGLCLLNQRAGKIIIRDSKKCDKRFLYYTLSCKDNARAIALMAHGAASQANVSPSQVESLMVPNPSLTTQHKIAAILSAYDDLIENNLRRIKILEEMAQRLYREWFVHFHFPGYERVPLVDSPLGKIPQGGEVRTLADILESIESGSRPKGGIDPEVKDIPSVGAENILGLGQYDYSKEKHISHEFFKNMRRGKVQSGDVLLYKDGAKIGRKSMFRAGFPHETCCINEHVFILRTKGECSQAYLYFWLDQPEMTARIIRLNSNAAQPGINQAGVKGLPILLPASPQLGKFDEIVEPTNLAGIV